MVLHYGTSSWSSKGWVGPFYPPGTPPGDFLSHYATQFDTVEADVTYYRVPDRKLVSGWDRKLPDGFRLSAKFPRNIVHAGKGPQPDSERLLIKANVRDECERFLEAMALLGDKCGPLVLQFPYFNRKAFTERAPFLDRLCAFLDELPAGFRYAVELRNKNWVDEELLDALRSRSIAFVLLDLIYMPHPDEFMPGLDLLTTDFTYTRLIGNRKAVDELTKTFDEVVIDKSSSLKRWAELLQSVNSRVPESYVYANNHYAGHGPATIRELAELIDSGTALK